MIVFCVLLWLFAGLSVFLNQYWLVTLSEKGNHQQGHLLHWGAAASLLMLGWPIFTALILADLYRHRRSGRGM